MARFLLSLITALFLFSVTFTLEDNASEFHPNAVNAVLGDVSYIKEFGVEPDSETSEAVRIITHLAFVGELLNKSNTNHLSSKQKQNRLKLIELLDEYKNAGVFPKNKHYTTRRPVFIDEEGTHCAVGYLIAKTAGPEAARKINESHKFDYISEINPKFIDSWLTEHGITKKEAAMIQPTYQYEQTINENNIEPEYIIGSSLLAGVQIGALTYSLLADESRANTKQISAVNTVLGLSNVALGLINLNNSYAEWTGYDSSTPCICYSVTTTYTNEARTNFSLANIVVGGASAIFNGYRFFRAGKKEVESGLHISAANLYNPASENFNPGLSVSLKF